MNRDFRDLSALPKRIFPITLLDRGVMRAGMSVYRGEKQIGWITSGTMVPYYCHEGEGLQTVILEESGKRAIGLAYLASDTLEDDIVEVDIRGRRLKADIPPIICRSLHLPMQGRFCTRERRLYSPFQRPRTTRPRHWS